VQGQKDGGVMRVVEEGQLKGAFKGFKNRKTEFTFFGSRRNWRQDEYKYLYHYAYMPKARVVVEGGRYFLEVDGVRERIAVREVR
jgi:hypothetical protein